MWNNSRSKATSSASRFLENSVNLKDLSNKFAVLDELNKILDKFLPLNLKTHCHIGAIDTSKNLIILYVDNPAIRHLVYSLANPILENFNTYHFSFAGVITRICKPKFVVDNMARYKNLDTRTIHKLRQLAENIDKPELVTEHLILDKINEIDL